MMYLINDAWIYTKLKHALETERWLWDLSQLYLTSLSHLDPMTKTLYEETLSCPPDSYGFHLPEWGYRSDQDKELIMDAVPGSVVSCFSTSLTYP